MLHRDPIDLTESASMAFLGLSLTCARCHNHPLEKWTQDQYYGFASLFARVKLKDGETAGDEVVANAARRGGPAPAPRGGDAAAGRSMAPPIAAGRPARSPRRVRRLAGPAGQSLFRQGGRQPRLEQLLRPGPGRPRGRPAGLQPAQRRSACSTGWSPTSSPIDYDVKHLIRTIMNSAVYARSSVPVPGNESDAKFLSHYRVKRLPAEVLLDAISRVTEVPTPFAGYPAGWRSLQLPDSKVDSTFLDSFGRPARLATCSCERSAEPSMAQALHLANGTTINEKLRSDSSVAAKAIAAQGRRRARSWTGCSWRPSARRPTRGGAATG